MFCEKKWWQKQTKLSAPIDIVSIPDYAQQLSAEVRNLYRCFNQVWLDHSAEFHNWEVLHIFYSHSNLILCLRGYRSISLRLFSSHTHELAEIALSYWDWAAARCRSWCASQSWHGTRHILPSCGHKNHMHTCVHTAEKPGFSQKSSVPRMIRSQYQSL